MKGVVLTLVLMGAGLAQAAPPCAQPGGAQAAYRRGLDYRNGVGAAPDAGLALQWLTRAAQCGMPAAMFLLSNALAAGEGGPADPVAARRWLEESAALGYPAALQELALREPDPRKAELLMRQAAHALQHRQAGAGRPPYD